MVIAVGTVSSAAVSHLITPSFIYTITPIKHEFIRIFKIDYCCKLQSVADTKTQIEFKLTCVLMQTNREVHVFERKTFLAQNSLFLQINIILIRFKLKLFEFSALFLV